MKTPLQINFDVPGLARDTVYLPKLQQGMPYAHVVTVRARDNGAILDFSGYADIVMRCVVQQNQPPFLTLSKQAGSIDTQYGLGLQLIASATENVKVPVVNLRAINELRFLHEIDLVHSNGTVERFAHGYGLLVAKL